MNPMKLADPEIRVRKSERLLELFDGSSLVRGCGVVLGFEPVGRKQVEGDGRTPEGDYYICAKNPESKYHLSLCISYPSVPDAERGLAAGLISDSEHRSIIEAVAAGKTPPQKTRLGGEIYIHGESGDRPTTAGCIRLSNEDMDFLFPLVGIGTRVVIEE